MQHASRLSPITGRADASRRAGEPRAAEITDIIAFDELADLDELGVLADLDAELDADAEFDDLDDTELDELPDTVAFGRQAAPGDADDIATVRLPRQSYDAAALRRGGKHRRQPVSAVRSRVVIAAMAAGAAAAAAHAATASADTAKKPSVLASAGDTIARDAGTPARGMQMITVKAAANVVVHNEELAKGMAFAQERAEREARLQRPLFVAPTKGAFTSNFGYRWGAMHAGIDIANSIGTPIYAASDGVVIEAGPAAGYGALVKIRHSDGTVTLYGHVNTWLVSPGERVMAGDQIATIGNRGYSTGPHCHFEVIQNGTTRIDPVPWLAQRGVNIT